MKKGLFAVALIAIGMVCYGQARVMLNNNPYIVMDGGVFIVVDNPNTNAITTLGTGGNIVSEDEDNKIRWNIGTNTGTYVVPWTTSLTNNTKIPLTVNITAAGTGSGRIDLSTYETSTDMNSPWPSMVTHMNDYATGTVNNTLFVTDRYWIIDANNYTARPTATLQFAYDDAANEIGGTNTITEANLAAQRFNDGNGTWGDYSPTGTANTTTNRVSGVGVVPADFFPAWTLVDRSSPLPIELIDFMASCQNDKVVLNWSTASENNNDYFTIERSLDGITFEDVMMVDGAGTSNTTIAYTATDEQPYSELSYYRIKQTDFNLQYTHSPVIPVEACNDATLDVIIYNNGEGGEQVGVGINSTVTEQYNVSLFDMRGRVIFQEIIMIQEGFNKFLINSNHLGFGVYMLKMESANHVISKRILLK